jgi:hypothetical protein
MFRWLFRIALGFAALKLVESYQRPAAGTKEKPQAGKPAADGGRTAKTK